MLEDELRSIRSEYSEQVPRVVAQPQIVSVECVLCWQDKRQRYKLEQAEDQIQVHGARWLI